VQRPQERTRMTSACGAGARGRGHDAPMHHQPSQSGHAPMMGGHVARRQARVDHAMVALGEKPFEHAHVASSDGRRGRAGLGPMATAMQPIEHVEVPSFCSDVDQRAHQHVGHVVTALVPVEHIEMTLSGRGTDRTLNVTRTSALVQRLERFELTSASGCRVGRSVPRAPTRPSPAHEARVSATRMERREVDSARLPRRRRLVC